MDYSKTLNLPKTDFPMRANLANRENDFLKNWYEKNIYNLIRKKRANADKYILHDGPPYANGAIHIGTALNKVLKDFVVKYKFMSGFDTPFVPGWDCHGLPIELKVMEQLGEKKNSMTQSQIREECKKYAEKYIEVQKKDFIRLGVFGRWDNPYLTMSKRYETGIIDMFLQLFENGYIYRGLKPIHWCSHCQTALAEAEVEYENHKSPAIFVSFKVTNFKNLNDLNNASFIIWTTTPWTLPANLAIAAHPDFEYVLIKSDKGKFVLAKELLKSVAEKLDLEYFVLNSYSGYELEGIVCRHPFMERDSIVINAYYVTLDTGSGLVHIAPGHGMEDYISSQKYNLEVYSPVDDKGCFTKEIKLWAGKNVFDANAEIIEHLKSINALLNSETVEHSYPHCWRCKKPIIFRATRQWFISIDKNNLRNKILEEIKKVKFIPDWGENRITGMLENRPDWCISRQRIWGVPIPAFFCKECGEVIMNEKTIAHFKNIVSEKGVDEWFNREVKDLLPKNIKCPKCGSSNFYKEKDILDVWFDSGSSHIGVLDYEEELHCPADMYLEGSDQHRGWFQVSLIPSVALKGISPFKELLTHGFIVDEQGKKMSKSEGNIVVPQEIISKYGADVLRLFIASENYQNDVKVSENLILKVAEAYKKIRNTLKFLLGNLNDFKYVDRIEYNELSYTDKYMLAKLYDLHKKITESYNEYKFHIVYQLVYNFCIVELSSFYLDISKDILYCEQKTSKKRRAIQTVFFEILSVLVYDLAPILMFTCEEAAQFYPELLKGETSIHLCDWLVLDEKFDNVKLIDDYQLFNNIRKDVLKAIEIERGRGIIGQPLESTITVYCNENIFNIVKENILTLKLITVVSEFNVKLNDDKMDINIFDGETVRVKVEKSKHKKCKRCWQYFEKLNDDEICDRCAAVVSDFNN